MKELINIVNSKFQAVIDELKNQKNTLEEKLKRIAEDIDKKVVIASKYKEDVEKSNNTISELESEIDKLKKDLHDLQEKFESAGFTGIVEAANKEINGKIIDNNTKISQARDNIKNYQDEVQNLKDELTTLKESKHNIEKELKNTSVALSYYSNRIDDITIYAIENSDKLEDYNKGLDDSSDEEVNKDIDDEIFNEIDEISAGNKEISDEELNELLSSDFETDDDEVELTKTQMLDDVINKTQEIINSNNTDNQFLSLLDENKEENNPEEIVPTEEVDNTIPTGNIEDLFVPTEEPINPPITESTELQIAPVMDEDDEEDFSEPVEETPTFEPAPELTAVNFEAVEPAPTEIQTTNMFIPENDEVKETINKLGLKYELFDDKINNIKSIDYDNAVRVIDCLDLHFIDSKNIYKNPSILVTVRPDVLDKILDLLEQAGCVSETFDYIFTYLDKIDVSILETKVSGKTDCIIDILYSSIPNLELKNVSEVFELTEEESRVLESKLDAREYNLMCGFTDIVKVNYDILNGYHIDNIKKAFTEHPKRFLLNPDVFDTILDKYDPQDLVRCINKNVAVLDRL